MKMNRISSRKWKSFSGSIKVAFELIEKDWYLIITFFKFINIKLNISDFICSLKK